MKLNTDSGIESKINNFYGECFAGGRDFSMMVEREKTRQLLLLFTSVMNVERVKIGAKETFTMISTNLVNTFVQMPHLCLVHLESRMLIICIVHVVERQ